MQPKHRQGELGVYTGSSRMGKTAALKQKIARHRRVIVWSVKEPVDRYADNWPGSIITTSRHELLAAIRTIGKGAGVIVYLPPPGDIREEFSFWCRAAFAWGKAHPATIVAEELADVSTPAKAPPGWGEICRQALGWGCNVYALTQRPAESDKTAIGNATYIHAHFSARPKDRKYLAEEMGVSVEALTALAPLEWIESSHSGKRITRGKVSFARIQKALPRKRKAG